MKYKAGDVLEIKNVPETYRHVFITAVKNGRYHVYFLTKPNDSYSYKISEFENRDVCFKVSV